MLTNSRNTTQNTEIHSEIQSRNSRNVVGIKNRIFLISCERQGKTNYIAMKIVFKVEEYYLRLMSFSSGVFIAENAKGFYNVHDDNDDDDNGGIIINYLVSLCNILIKNQKKNCVPCSAMMHT